MRESDLRCIFLLVKAKTAKKKAESRKSAPALVEESAPEGDGKLESVLKEVTAGGGEDRVEDWVSLECPYCGEGFEVHVTSEQDGQSMVEDCAVCCRPVQLLVEIQEGEIQVDAQRS